jgi:RimJ/RimL family protein N-acetyltransferase
VTLTCRPAKRADAELLWRWANDPEARRQSFTKAAIAWDAHVAWLEARLASPACTILIFSDGGVPVGQVRFDVVGDMAEISISVAPEQRGRGYGRAMLASALERHSEQRGERVRTRASVLAANERSLRMFRASGFRDVDQTNSPNGERVIVLEWVRAAATAARE